MTRPDRSWTATLAECGLDRAQPVLALFMPQLFNCINLSHALSATGVMADRNTAFAMLGARLADNLGSDTALGMDALARLPFDPEAAPATVFWHRLHRRLSRACRGG